MSIDFVWGMLLSGSAIIAAVCGPFAGRVADRRGRWLVFAVVAVASFLSAIGLSAVIGEVTFEYPHVVFAASALFYLAGQPLRLIVEESLQWSEQAMPSRVLHGASGYLGGILPAFLGLLAAGPDRS